MMLERAATRQKTRAKVHSDQAFSPLDIPLRSLILICHALCQSLTCRCSSFPEFQKCGRCTRKESRASLILVAWALDDVVMAGQRRGVVQRNVVSGGPQPTAVPIPLYEASSQIR